MRGGIDGLARQIHDANDLLLRASKAGMEVSRPRFELNDAVEKLIDARVLVHSFSPEQIDGDVKQGESVAAKSQAAGSAALAELQFRRKGLAASLVVIFVSVVALALKIRRMGERGK